MQLYIGNKNYSSWSMRPWVLMRQAGIAVRGSAWLRFDAFDAGLARSSAVRALTPGRPRAGARHDDGFAVWDTLAIAEYLAEKFPDRNAVAGARRSACARAQPLRRDARRLRRIAHPLHDEHRGVAARRGRGACSPSSPACATISHRIVQMW